MLFRSAAGAAGAPRPGASLLSAGTLPMSLSLGFGPSSLGLGLGLGALGLADGATDGAPGLPRWPGALLGGGDGGASRGTLAPSLGQMWQRQSGGALSLELLAKGHGSGGTAAETAHVPMPLAEAAGAAGAAATAAAAPGSAGSDEEVNAPASAPRRLLLLQHALNSAAGAETALKAAAAEGAVRDIARVSPLYDGLRELQRLLLEDMLATGTQIPAPAAPPAAVAKAEEPAPAVATTAV